MPSQNTEYCTTLLNIVNVKTLLTSLVVMFPCTDCLFLKFFRNNEIFQLIRDLLQHT